jgi:hypothetical protein
VERAQIFFCTFDPYLKTRASRFERVRDCTQSRRNCRRTTSSCIRGSSESAKPCQPRSAAAVDLARALEIAQCQRLATHGAAPR